MAYDSKVLTSQRMKNLLACSIGGCVGSVILAIDGVNTENIQSTGTPVMFLGTGVLSAAIAAAELDLSSSAVCAQAGQTIEAGNDFCLFVLQDGTNAPIVVLGDEDKTISRSSATSALVTSIDYKTVPANLDMTTYVVSGYVKVVSTIDFVIGTTAFDAAGVTDTYVNLSNAIPGSKMA